jgi:nicotinamide mononucleotide (NMN) deamidase PncC
MEDQPVGTVWIGVAIDGVAYAAHGCSGGEPAAIRQAAIEAALTEATREMRRAGVVEPIPDM